MNQKNQHDGEEKRKYMRYACTTELETIVDFNPEVARRALGKYPPITFRKGEKAAIRNISQKGISIELDHLLPAGITIKIAIDNPVTPPIKTGARVIWSKKQSGSDKGYIMGMVYKYMREKHRRNLEKLLEFLQEIPD
jgi:hypothetical protein